MIKCLRQSSRIVLLSKKNLTVVPKIDRKTYQTPKYDVHFIFRQRKVGFVTRVMRLFIIITNIRTFMYFIHNKLGRLKLGPSLSLDRPRALILFYCIN